MKDMTLQDPQNLLTEFPLNGPQYVPFPEAPPPAAIPTTSKHIILEGFPRIKDKSGPPRVPPREVINLVRKIFPSVFEVSVNTTFMIVRCRTLPLKPWPLTLGGIPLWLTVSATDTPMADGRAGRAPPVLHDLRLSKVSCPAGEEFALIAKYFVEELGILVSEIMWSGVLLRLRVPDGAQATALPFKIGGLLALYDTTSAVPENGESAKRFVSSTAAVRGDKPATQIPSLSKAAGLRIGELLMVEDASSRSCEGVFTDAIWLRSPENERGEMPGVVILSFYVGNGREEPLPGSSDGSPVLTEDGEVVGLFRFATATGRAYCVSIEPSMGKEQWRLKRPVLAYETRRQAYA